MHITGLVAPQTTRPSNVLDELDFDLDETLGPSAASPEPSKRGHTSPFIGQQLPKQTALLPARPSTSRGPQTAPAQSVGGGSRTQGRGVSEDPGTFSLDEEQLEMLML